MKIKKHTLLATALILLSKNAFCLPKDLNVKKILEENSLVIKTMNEMGVNPIDIGEELKKSVEPKQSIGENYARKCIDKERSLGKGIIKCKNGYFKEE